MIKFQVAWLCDLMIQLPRCYDHPRHLDSGTPFRNDEVRDNCKDEEKTKQRIPLKFIHYHLM